MRRGGRVDRSYRIGCGACIFQHGIQIGDQNGGFCTVQGLFGIEVIIIIPVDHAYLFQQCHVGSCLGGNAVVILEGSGGFACRIGGNSLGQRTTENGCCLFSCGGQTGAVFHKAAQIRGGGKNSVFQTIGNSGIRPRRDAVCAHDWCPFLCYSAVCACLSCLQQKLIGKLTGFGKGNGVLGAEIVFSVFCFADNQIQIRCFIDGGFGAGPRCQIHIRKGQRICGNGLTGEHDRQS